MGVLLLLLGRAGSAVALRPAAQLVEVHGADQHGADGNLLPERLNAHDHEAVLQHGRDEHSKDGSEDRADPPNRLVPPITTAAIDWRLLVSCPPIVVVEKRARFMKPDQAGQRSASP